ncbi:hypothetical protein R3I94_001302 [Phoxinus phoxinus]
MWAGRVADVRTQVTRRSAPSEDARCRDALRSDGYWTLFRRFRRKPQEFVEKKRRDAAREFRRPGECWNLEGSRSFLPWE